VCLCDVFNQTLLNPSLLNTHRGLIDLVQQFLEHIHWERGKSDLARKVSFTRALCSHLVHFIPVITSDMLQWTSRLLFLLADVAVTHLNE